MDFGKGPEIVDASTGKVRSGNHNLRRTRSFWAKAKLHGNCHVQFEKCYYSAPCRLVHRELWLRAKEKTVEIYHEHVLVAVHPRLHRPGSRSTIEEHLPPETVAYKMRDPQWCIKQAQGIGPRCLALIEALFADRVLDNLRSAQGVISLVKKFGRSRLEAACRRALHFGDPITIKEAIMPENVATLFNFDPLKQRWVEADFSGGHLSSDGGLLLLRQIDNSLGLSAKPASCFSDNRNPVFVEHSLPELIAQRLYTLALGYEDLNDHNSLPD